MPAAPPSPPTGTTQLPLSRVKKMIALDSDIHMCQNSAAFVITLATEMFIQYMAEQGHNVVRSERKPRRNIQYKDLASAVARLDNLEFVSDIVPRTVPYKAIKEKKPAATSSSLASAPLPIPTNGESSKTTDGKQQPLINGTNGFSVAGFNANTSVEETDDPNAQLERENADSRMSIGSAGGIVNQEDVEMRQ